MHGSDCALQLKVSAEVTLPQQESGRVLDSLYKSLWRLNNTFMSLMAAGRNAEMFLPAHVTPTNAIFLSCDVLHWSAGPWDQHFCYRWCRRNKIKFVSLSTNVVIQCVYLFCPHVVPLMPPSPPGQPHVPCCLKPWNKNTCESAAF